MESRQLIDKLVSLVLLDIDAIHAYDQAMINLSMNVLSVKNQFLQFKYDHERHVQNLTDCIHRIGSEAPQFSKEFKGFSFSKFKSLEKVQELEEILNMMLENERCTNMTYDDVLSFDLPDEVRMTVKNNRDDERRHLKYIKNCIESKIWLKKVA